ncbi:exodeoxyribonuclease VII large subunit, partial [Aquibium carbonis]
CDDRVANLGRRADRAADVRLARLADRLAQAGRLNASLSYKAVLERGFVVVHDASGAPVKRAADLSGGDRVALQFADASAGAMITGDGASRLRPARTAKPGGGGQGSLF